MARYHVCLLFLASALAFKIAVSAELDDDIFAKEKTLKEGPMFNRTTSAAVVKDWAWSTMMTLYNISFPGASPTSMLFASFSFYVIYLLSKVIHCKVSKLQYCYPRYNTILQGAMRGKNFDNK